MGVTSTAVDERYWGQPPIPAHVEPASAALTVVPALIAGATLGAALVHAAAAGSHNGDRVLAIAFAMTAVVQLGVAAAVIAFRDRRSLAVAIAVHASVMAAWTASRLTGISFIGGLEHRQAIGLADATATGLEATATVLAVLALTVASVRTAARGGWALAAGVAAVVLAVPGMAAPHGHAGGDSDTAVVARGDGHAHGAGTAGPGSASVPSAGDPNVVLGIRLPPVEGVTDAQKLEAARLIKETQTAIVKYSSPMAARAAGYESIGDGATGFDHYVNREFTANAAILDPNQPESLVYEVKPDGSRVLVSAMYILPPGSTMADVPDIAGPMTQWHDHQNLCWDETGTRLRGVLVNGKCTPGGRFRATAPMLHVWLTEHPCGPFAGIEGGGHTGACHAAHE